MRAQTKFLLAVPVFLAFLGFASLSQAAPFAAASAAMAIANQPSLSEGLVQQAHYTGHSHHHRSHHRYHHSHHHYHHHRYHHHYHHHGSHHHRR